MNIPSPRLADLARSIPWKGQKGTRPASDEIRKSKIMMRLLIITALCSFTTCASATPKCQAIFNYNMHHAHAYWKTPPFKCAAELGMLVDKVCTEDELPTDGTFIPGNGLFYDHSGKLGYICPP